ncbi:MAG: ABC transporter permease subunit [Fimbriimonas sp.]|nr:ABC transporter permease subunit [Fimbriimonas sp.]
MIQDRLRTLVTQNPMLIEITRFRRRYFSYSSGNSMNSVVLSLVLICYAGLVLIVAQNRDSINPISIVIFETGLLTLFAPMMLYGAIAGERERRSWDLLLAAPITKSQIVAGKFLGAAGALVIAVAMFQLPILIAAIGSRETNWWFLLVASLDSLTFLLLVCALTIFFSARVKRGLMALGAVLAILATGLIVFPTFVEVAGGSSSTVTNPTLFFHPFYVMAQLMRTIGPGEDAGNAISTLQWGWPQSFVYFALTITLLAWASNTLSFAENEVKFMPQGDKHA